MRASGRRGAGAPPSGARDPREAFVKSELRNRQIVLAARPVGLPKSSDFRLVEGPIPEPAPGEFLVAGRYLSLDPYMRGRMSDAPSYARPVQVGEVMVGAVVGAVVRSNHPDFRVGDIVEDRVGWQEYGLSGGRDARK